jgi:2-phospho-L-lactate guanylyltransferase
MTKDQRASHREVWAVVPVKHTAQAKQRPAKLLSLDLRQELALAMLEDVLQALGVAPHLAGIVIVTVDAQARKLASRCGAETWTCGAEDGHTGAVTAAARRLAANHAIMLTIPGDVPLVSAADIARLVAAHSAEPAFTIVPARDERGSNAILCSPADRVPLRILPPRGAAAWSRPSSAATRSRSISTSPPTSPGSCSVPPPRALGLCSTSTGPHGKKRHDA